MQLPEGGGVVASAGERIGQGDALDRGRVDGVLRGRGGRQILPSLQCDAIAPDAVRRWIQSGEQGGA